MRIQVRTSPRGLALTEIGLGTSQLGNLYRETSDEEAFGAITAAWECGIRYFDTAPHYGVGLSERRVGRLLSAFPRDEFVLSTKVGRLLEAHPLAIGRDSGGFDVPATWQRRWDLSRDGIRRSVEDSLQRLGLDRIDIAYLHDPDEFLDDAVSTGLPALIELRDEGVLRAVGAGMNHTAPLARFIRETDIDAVMIAGKYTLLDRSADQDLLTEAGGRGVAVIAAGVYNSGILATSRPQAGAKFNYADADRALIDRANQFADAAEAASTDLPTLAVQFPLRSTIVTSVVVGARNQAQVNDLAARYRTHVADGVWATIDRIPTRDRL